MRSASARQTRVRDGQSGPSGLSVRPSAEVAPQPLIDTALTAHRVSADASASQVCQPSVTPRPVLHGLIGARSVPVRFHVVVESLLNPDNVLAVYPELNVSEITREQSLVTSISARCGQPGETGATVQSLVERELDQETDLALLKAPALDRVPVPTTSNSVALLNVHRGLNGVTTPHVLSLAEAV